MKYSSQVKIANLFHAVLLMSFSSTHYVLIVKTAFLNASPTENANFHGINIGATD